MSEQLASVTALPLQGARPTLDDSVDLRELIPGALSVRAPIRYSDGSWDFDGFPLVNQTVSRLDFAGLPARWRFVVRDWVLLRLNPALAQDGASGLDTDDVMAAAAAGQKPLKLPSALAYVAALTAALAVIERNGWDRLGPDAWSSFADQLAADNPGASPGTLALYSRPLLSLWSYRGLLGLPDMFGGKPFGGRTVEQAFKVPRRDLNVERPAPELVGPLLGLSLWMLDHCADDVLARLEALAAAPDRTGLPRKQQVVAVTEWLLAWERTGRPLPGLRGLRDGAAAPAWATFVKLSGCSPEALRNPVGDAVPLLARLRAEHGVDADDDGFDLPIAQVPAADGILRPWTDGLPPTKFGLGLDHWSCALAYACAFVITTMTTVRDRELAALPHDCLVEGTYERGDVDVPVTRTRGYLVKNRTDPVPTTWVVGDDVVAAVRILHRLKAALRLPPSPHPQTGREVLMHPGLGRGRDRRKATDTLALDSGYLAWFRASGAFLAARGLVPDLPDLPRWLSHRAVRMTGIEAYADQRWGDAFAAAQAHWSSRTVAEGYLGHLPRSVCMADPDAVEEARQRSVGLALLDAAHDPASLAGNGIERLEGVLEEAGAHALATTPVTNAQVAQFGRDNPNVYVGELTICVFGPGGLCGNEEQADFKLCRPFACRNSAMTRAQRARLELRRRGWARRSGVFARARSKIEADAPGLADEFEQHDDAALRSLVLEDLPGRYQRAAEQEGSR